jgi:hypothetical protein
VREGVWLIKRTNCFAMNFTNYLALKKTALPNVNAGIFFGGTPLRFGTERQSEQLLEQRYNNSESMSRGRSLNLGGQQKNLFRGFFCTEAGGFELPSTEAKS